MNSIHKNRLISETSPYLLQHADNPVDWYPWGDDALEKARREDKPILLSIGYSACHWCHVMAHESFEDEATAAVMNELFVNIKVDREERPDLDKIYQLAHQILARRPGGWPLTMFLHPHNQLPFFGGTYFPNTARHQLPAFSSLLRQVAGYYRQQKQDLEDHNKSFADILQSIRQQGGREAPDVSILTKARRELEADFDSVNGGFGDAPKFPQTSNLEFLLRLWSQSPDEHASGLRMVTTTLTKMAEGGIYDQIGGGFCRYSVDAAWEIPHFEKMLYDNGVFLSLYAEAWRVTRNPLFRKIAEETAEWALREMQSPEGGFYSSLDADSEGEEGKYYVWDRSEVKDLLSTEEYAVVELHYGLNRTPNFEGHWHLHVDAPLQEVATRLGIDPAEAERRLASARATLLKAREKRIRPGRDDKVLTAWNGLMIKGLAVAGRLLERNDFIEAADRAFEFLRREVCVGENRLLATYKDGKAHLNAYLDDYAFLLDAGLELLQCQWRTDRLDWLLKLADQLLARFEDHEQGGFFFTSDDHEALIQRPKTLMDESMPSGNGIAALVLLRLGHLVGEYRYTEAAERTLKAAVPSVRQYPHAHGALLNAMLEWLYPPEFVVLRGKPEALRAWIDAIHGSPATGAHRLSFAIPADEQTLPGVLAERKTEAGEVAYVCSGMTCLAPIHSLSEFKAFLQTSIEKSS
ncbi:thioredoxin domain-containing protein [Methylocaldum sp.]|uniref:thioredoxin domain-containing protein n=1 Tax=Methylocaldum sp. TaxID=1969727 RepID=UPI002D39D0D9|nr:thioredoxin domain-containing protein [Methylocaldum sp.]HYE37768.1 thioredoxin domain-containing protein [Methylocaldum sp.]